MRRCTVLVVDGDAVIRDVLSDLLALEGCDPLPAASGEQALDLIAARSPDLILLDLELPGLTGRGLAYELQARGVDLPIIVISAAENGRRIAREVQAKAYLSKPFDIQTLLDLVADLCPPFS